MLARIWSIKIGFIIKNTEFLAEHTIKTEISKLLSNYEYGNNIYEHRKQQNKWTEKNYSELDSKIRFKKLE